MTACGKQADSACCLSMQHHKSHLHGGCLGHVVTVKTGMAGLGTITAPAPDRGQSVCDRARAERPFGSYSCDPY